jgi:(1->4)-alpha-D-glucan 1-alpha-D-glucosylmutase
VDAPVTPVVAARARRRRSKKADAALVGELPPIGSALAPRSTYRVQLHGGFGFAHAAALLPYLQALGIGHLYASPYLKARAGSTHGYDIVDHNALNPQIGTSQEFERMCSALREHGMQQLVDVVPNHMGVLQADNAWWNDVLEHGEASEHAETFDIDWAPAAADMRGQVLLPVLGDQYGEVLERGELSLAFDAATATFRVAYYEHRFPLDPREAVAVLRAVPLPYDRAEGVAQVHALIDGLARLPARDIKTERARTARRRAVGKLKDTLRRLHADLPWLAGWIDGCLQTFSGRPGEPRSFDALDALIRRQPWRLAHWRVASDEVNYRRFFDVSTLAAMRMEREAVFEATHRTLLGWVGDGTIDGLRIDHPDGLAYPARYFERLQRAALQARREAKPDTPPRALYVVIEKILAEHEHWPDSWPVHGDTGYRYANQVNALFVDGRSEAAFDRLYAEFAGRRIDYDAELLEAKRTIMSTSLAADLHMLTESVYRIAQGDRRTRDFTRNGLKAALAELAAGFPVYRTYFDGGPVQDVDRRHLDWAVGMAKRRGAAEALTIDYLRRLMLEVGNESDAARKEALLAFVCRFQQFTAPVMAKSMEDTAFYRYHRLVSLNDVGGSPKQFGSSVHAFHVANQARERFMPHTLLCTSTHDSKRSEDVRARIDVLSELPQSFADALGRWDEMVRRVAVRDESSVELDRNDLYLLFQTLVGVWPAGRIDAAGLDALRRRVQDYMRKAMREAKQRTSWTHPNEPYEAAFANAVDALLGQLEPNPFLTDLAAFVEQIAPFGYSNSLNMVALKLTSPGVPDIYQGCESWNFSLVDPDNRRPVDFDSLRSQLAALQTMWHGDGTQADDVGALWSTLADGRLKLLVTWRLLQLRAAQPELFARGLYRPLAASGVAADHVVAYAREHERAAAVTVGSRFACTLLAGEQRQLLTADWQAAWEDTAVALPGMPGAAWRDVLTGRRVVTEAGEQGAVLALREALQLLPLAVLVPADSAR